LADLEEKRRKAAKRTREWRVNNRERARASDRARYLANRDEILAYEKTPARRKSRRLRMRSWRATNRELSRIQFRAWNYGVSIEKIKELLAGGCDVCGSADRLHIDHDHDCCPTGASPRSCGKCVRGVLCHSCNTALGLLQESPDRIEALLKHVQSRRPMNLNP
jgi:hypothetical protein